jgi:hypothetical protein
MDFFQIINIVANSVICVGMAAFFVLVYGNANSIVQKWPPLQHWFLKVSLVSIIASSAWNSMNVVYKMAIPRAADVITYTQTPIGEIFLNVGLAMLFSWVVYFHKFHFLKVAPPKVTKRTVKKSTRKK